MFLGIGIEKLTGTMGTIPFFDAIGWGQWFRYASGALDTAGPCSSCCRAGPSMAPHYYVHSRPGTVLCFTSRVYNPLFPLLMTVLAATLVWLAWKPKPA